ncbi:hypothetical protein FA15DRAFT_698143 [Coprinopsis marcescibilis]|uniref:Nephrocystin 3-like N-terminal domain-containing protein n=1 Tax=Coprinopsis marcescibilis TaxID=230819 RepID=A0A5C3KDU5_COPMA|nr:hypothetical protein FA15DRAFT_698143 [Coprinopsis marcescibilis]
MPGCFGSCSFWGKGKRGQSSTTGDQTELSTTPVSQAYREATSIHATPMDSTSIPSAGQVQATSTAAYAGNGPNQNLHGNGFFTSASGFSVINSHMVDYSVNISSLREARVNGLEKLLNHIAPSALYNSAERFDPPKCDENTRVRLLQELMSWQTTIEGSAKDGNLLAAFFFFAGDGQRNLLDPLIPTIAYQIAQRITEANEPIMLAVERNPTIFNLKMEAQAESLIIEPLRQAMSATGVSTANWPCTIFIDGIDECRGEENQSRLLSMVKAITLAFNNTDFRIKFLLASRPEYAMRTAISSKGIFGATDNFLHCIDLSKYDATADIRLYLKRHLRNIGNSSDYPLPSTGVWPSDEDIETLVANASGQFIYASTIVKYLSDRRRSPVKHLQLILSWRPGVLQKERPFAALDTLYTNIFVSAQETYSGSRDIDDPLVIVRYIRMLQLVEEEAKISVRISSLEGIMSLDQGELDIVISDLHSIVKSLGDHYRDPSLQLRFHHKSVSDFLGDSSRSGPLFVSLQTAAMQWLTRSTAWIEEADSTETRSWTNNPCGGEMSGAGSTAIAVVTIWNYCANKFWDRYLLNPDDELRYLGLLVTAQPSFWENIRLASIDSKRGLRTARGVVGRYLAQCEGEVFDICGSSVELHDLQEVLRKLKW